MRILQQLENHEILILGDVMIDRYLTGSVNRISPEAPVPVVLHQATEDRLGGAANVALNIRALGSIPVLCSVIGRDEAGNQLKDNILPDKQYRFGWPMPDVAHHGQNQDIGKQPADAAHRQ